MARNLQRFYGTKDLHFVTFSCYRRLPLLASARRRDLFLRALETTCRNHGMTVCGYVVMPEHVHLLVAEPERGDLSTAIKALKQGFSRQVMNRLRRRIQEQTELFQPPWPRFWQARFYDFSVWTEKKRIGKLRYMHRNPVQRGLVTRPDHWRWSSFRSYACGEPGLVTLNVIPPLRVRAATAAR